MTPINKLKVIPEVLGERGKKSPRNPYVVFLFLVELLNRLFVVIVSVRVLLRLQKLPHESFANSRYQRVGTGLKIKLKRER